MTLDEFIRVLELLSKYSNNMLFAVLLLAWLLRREVVVPFKKMRAWIDHFLEVHEEDLFTGGRVERLVKDILEELRRHNQHHEKKSWWFWRK